MNSATAYAELGLKPDATEADVKAAWRRLVSRWHPDRNSSAAAVARMQRINQALEAIRNAGFSTVPEARREEPARPASRPSPRPTTRARPSPHGARGTPPPAAPPPSAAPPPATDPAANARGAEHATAARTIHRKVKLSLEQAAIGCTVDLCGRYTPLCAGCSGLGHVVLGGTCKPCGGSGALRRSGWYGMFSSQAECEDCHGSGRAQRRCAECKGKGRMAARNYRVTVRIPHGARDGDRLHVPARSKAGDAAPGDFDLQVQLLPHRSFELEADGTLRSTLKVNGFAWVTEREVEVPTLQGRMSVRLRRDQTLLRLKGQGFPVHRRGERGDLLVTVVPEFPERYTPEQAALIDQLIVGTARS